MLLVVTLLPPVVLQVPSKKGKFWMYFTQNTLKQLCHVVFVAAGWNVQLRLI